MKNSCNYLIIGSGITGLTVAYELIKRGKNNVIIIEKEKDLGVHASGRNSGVLHSGIYYSPDSLKARFCAEGNDLLSRYCEDKGIPIRRCGKVIIPTSKEKTRDLHILKKRADSNGVECLVLEPKDLKKIEPYAYTPTIALYTPKTSVFDPIQVLYSLFNDLKESGRVNFLFGTAFESVEGSSSVKTTSGVIRFNYLINCAGAYADKIAHQYGVGLRYSILPFLGTYKKLKREYSYLVKGNIYPVPDLRNPFLGVHFTRSIHDEVYIGPTALPSLGREGYSLFDDFSWESLSILYRDLLLFFYNKVFRDNALSEFRKYFSRYVYMEAKKMVPELKYSYIVNSKKSGIRPQLVDIKENRLVDDFVVEKKDNTVHILNAISPAFTSSMAFSRYVVDTFIEG